MRIISGTVRGALRLERIRGLSRAGKVRLQWMDYYTAHGGNAALTCRHFGISRQTFYRWKGRYNPRDLTSLEERSHRPKRLRQPTWSRELALAVLHLREQYPRWGKDKLAVLLRGRGWQVSTSMVGRILTRLKARGVLREPLRTGVSTRKRLWRRPYAVRKPKGYAVQEPGDLVQVDTLDVRPLPGMVLKHFTARDVVSRWDVIEAHTRATAIPIHRDGIPGSAAPILRLKDPSPSRPSRWTEAQSSRLPLKRNASAVVSASSCCHPAHPSSTAPWNVPSAPIRSPPQADMRLWSSPWRWPP